MFLPRERKDRTNRLCKRMGLFEKLLPDTIPLTEEQFQTHPPRRAQKWRQRVTPRLPSKLPIQRRRAAQAGTQRKDNGPL